MYMKSVIWYSVHQHWYSIQDSSNRVTLLSWHTACFTVTTTTPAIRTKLLALRFRKCWNSALNCGQALSSSILWVSVCDSTIIIPSTIRQCTIGQALSESKRTGHENILDKADAAGDRVQVFQLRVFISFCFCFTFLYSRIVSVQNAGDLHIRWHTSLPALFPYTGFAPLLPELLKFNAVKLMAILCSESALICSDGIKSTVQEKGTSTYTQYVKQNLWHSLAERKHMHRVVLL